MSDTPRYRVLHSLGKGGMGEVFLADDTQLGRKVAIKFLADGATNDSRALDRLYREARSAAALDHPFICKIYEITEVEGKTGIVMEHVSGETLQAELARTPLSPKRAFEIAREVAEALEEAHRKRVVHRDTYAACPPVQHPPGSTLLLKAIEIRFPTQGQKSHRDAVTYVRQIEMRRHVSLPSQDRWYGGGVSSVL